MPFESNNRDFFTKCEAHQLEMAEGGKDFVYSFTESGSNERDIRKMNVILQDALKYVGFLLKGEKEMLMLLSKVM